MPGTGNIGETISSTSQTSGETTTTAPSEETTPSESLPAGAAPSTLENPVKPIEELTLGAEYLKKPYLEPKEMDEYLSERLSSALTYGTPFSDIFIGGEYKYLENSSDLTPILIKGDEEACEEGVKEAFGDIRGIVEDGKTYVAKFSEPREDTTKFSHPIKVLNLELSDSAVNSFRYQQLANTITLEINVYGSDGMLEKQWLAPVLKSVSRTFIPTSPDGKQGTWRYTLTPPDKDHLPS